MKATVTTHGGNPGPDGVPYVQHWALHVDGRWIADTSSPRDRDFFQRIADAVNRDDAECYEEAG